MRYIMAVNSRYKMRAMTIPIPTPRFSPALNRISSRPSIQFRSS